ncbi:MAG: glucoamylase family protein, partial [Abditibacteriaceae bacterium]
DSAAKFEVRQGPASPEQLQQSAQRLAARHLRELKAEEIPRKQLLLARLLENQSVISALYKQLSIAARTEGAPSLSAEWLLDNHYLIQENIEDIKTNLGQSFYNELPRASSGAPRVYEIAMELIARTDGRLDVTNITSFLKHYQEVLPLSIGELWALPQMLRLALIEHQRGLFIATGKRQQDREIADFWANRLLNAAHLDPDRLHGILGALTEEQVEVHPHFVDRLVSHLYDEDNAMQPVQTWLERKCNAPLAEVSNDERTRHAADQVAIANTIGSQRALGQMDWNNIFEQISLVHELLAEDPAGIYSRMNFKTRNSYRREVEYVAKHSKGTEIDVSHHVLELTRQHSSNGLAHHVGYYLLDDGREMLEAACVYKPPLRAQARRILKENALPFYLSGIGVLTVAGALKVLLRGGSWHPLLGLLSIFPASSIGVELVNYFATKLLEPHSLPRLDFDEGIPAECKTIVVIPMMFSSMDDTREAVEALEIRYLGNIDPQIKFALLADYTDATTATTPEDQERLDVAAAGINNLNGRYPNAPFYLFLRDRRWSESEAKWMGWERKRGKLEELNNWLVGERSNDSGHLHPACGDTAALENIHYVLTLDADTQLPPECAQHLIETIAHPLNKVTDASGDTVQSGYTIIQPRISVSLPSANANRFTQLFAGGAGTDPYTHAVSDVYQDLFSQSSFQGKGIYDLAAFHQHLGERFPDATILSHDLLEGEHVRTGLASEIELFDDFPDSYLADTSRIHRWIRGDWQIADWATPRVPDNKGRLVPNPLSLLSRWKVADNLRRSLVKPALMGILLGGWTFGAAPAVSILAAGCLLIPVGLQVLSLLAPPWNNWPQKIVDLRDSLLRGLINTAFLPHNAGIATDAIIKVWQRRLLTKHDLLEWQTAQSAARGAAGRQQNLMRQSILGSIGSLAGIGLLAAFAPVSLPWALPFLGLWSAVPLILRLLSSGAPTSLQSELHEEDRQWLRRVARRTWRYFDDFVGPQTNWLPPDNYQETLQVEMALRTSPTNIGLWLLAALAARDFGYLPLDDAVGRVLETLRVTAEMEKYNGHLLNWYNTETLEPLRPRYVSTVDSGNLLGALTTLESGFRECQNAPLLDQFVLDGALDTIAVLEETLHLPDDKWGKEITDLVQQLKVLLSETPCSPQEILSRLRQALPLAENLTLHIRPQEADLKAIAFPQPSNTLDPRQGAVELNYWVAALEQQLQGWNHLCNRYLQWYEKLAETTSEFLAPLGAEIVAARQNLLETIPSLEDLGHGNLPDAKVLLDAAENLPQPAGLNDWLINFKTSYERAQWLAGEMLASSHELLDRARKLADDVDLTFLYDPALELFTIGFDVDELRLDSSYYDLMSSECRITSLMAIARRDVPVEHWWALGRRFARAYGQTVMLSWSGTMFEYLMPVLLHEQRQNTLLYRSNQAAVQTQMKYAKRRGIPWGISEAAFSALDANSIYQYKAFGVPELGLQRGHENDLVVAPYASLMALQIAPRAAIDNLKVLQSLGAYGVYGFYDSVDFSRQRLDDTPRQEALMRSVNPFQQGERGTIVRTFMVHHQGMGLLAIANLLIRRGDGQGVMQHRYHADPRIRAITPLLHERVPTMPVLLSAHQEQQLPERKITSMGLTEPVADRFRTPDTPTPHAHLMSNGHYHLMVSNSGGGYSKWNNFDITRWRADTTTDSMGSFFYIRDIDSRVLWSAAHHPVRRAARYQNIDFKAEKVDFRRRDADIETQTEVFVSPEDDVEIRLITLTNHSTHERNLEITSYQELALAPHAADRAHPAFAKLFVQTEALQNESDCALLAWRRLREPSEDPIWAAHFFTAGDQPSHSGRTQRQSSAFETSREHFLGRGRSPHRPLALETGLTGTAGAVLDPVFSLQQRWTLAPGERVQLAAVTAAGASRANVLSLIEKYRDFSAVKRAADMAWTHAQLEMHHLRIQPEEAQLFQQLSGGMIYPQAHYRARSAQLRQNNLGQQGLWSMGISGDFPIIV